MRPTFQAWLSGRAARLQFLHACRFLAALAVCLTAAGALAQENPGDAPPAPLSHNRFLFVVDTSSGMRRYADSTEKAMETLIHTAADGQLHTGDSIGVWTFNEDVFTGRMPLQTWTPADSTEIALHVGEFLRHQKFEKTSRMDQAMSAIGKVVKLSDLITVVIVSDGKSPIVGTPFDDEINQQYVENLDQMKKNAKPVVTVLQGKGGKFIKRYTVTTLEWGIVIPDLPIAIKGAPAEATDEAAAKPAPVRTGPLKGPSMVLVGPQPPDFPMSATVTTPAPATPPPVAQPPVAPVAAPAPVVAQSPAPAPAPVSASPITPAPATIAETAPPVPAPAPSTPAPHPISPESYVNPGHPYVAPPPAASQPPIASEPVVAATAPGSVGSPAVPTSSLATVSPAPVVDNAKPASAAVAAVHPSFLGRAISSVKALFGDHQTLLLVGGVVLLVVALGLILMVFRRPAVARVSLISQIMNNQPR